MRDHIRDHFDADGIQFLTYVPPSGTAYPLVFIRLPKSASAGRFLIVLRWARPRAMIVNNAPHQAYVAEKMDVDEHDADMIASVVRYILHETNNP